MTLLIRDLGTNVPDGLRCSAGIDSDPDRLIAAVHQKGLEGIVAKRRDSFYEPSQRSGAWVKLKTDREEVFLIGGYRPGASRDSCESLLVGYDDGDGLRCCAIVEAGFTPFQQRALMREVARMRIAQCPFVNLPQRSRDRWGSGITEDEMSRYVWMKPKLRAVIRFTEWTEARQLRHCVFVKLVPGTD